MNEPTQEELLRATTPDAMAELMAKYGGEDDQPEGDTEDDSQAVADAATDAKPEDDATPGVSSTQAETITAATAQPEADETEPPQGIATKSGRGVLPYRVLQEERQERKHWRDHAKSLEERLAQAQQEIDALKGAGSQQQQADALADLSDEEIEAAETDFPLLGKVARRLKLQAAAQAAPVTAAKPQQPNPEDQQAEADEVRAQVFADLKGRTLLAKLGQENGDDWEQAKALDERLRMDPKWGQVSQADRFKEVERRMAALLGVQLEQPQPDPQANKPKPTAKQPRVESFTPNTLSDLQGGAAASHDPISEKADGMALANRFMTMSQAEIDAVIRRQG